jgi:hypothetical protein
MPSAPVEMTTLRDLSSPAEDFEFVFGTDKFNSAVVEQDAAAYGVVVVEGK